MNRTIPNSIKGWNSITKPPTGERYVLVFDFETTGLPLDSWADFQPYYTIKKWKDGKPMLSNVPLTDKKGIPIFDYNGKQKYEKKTVTIPASNPEHWPHALQLCYILYDNQENTAKIVNEIIRLPDGVTISPESEAIHKISLEQSRASKFKIGDLLPQFIEDYKKADIVVAHNIRFDRNLMLAELSRLKMEDFIQEFYYNKKEYCTADFGADLCQIEATNTTGKKYYKMPRLKVLYEKIFASSPDDSKLHDALIDVIVCFRCFYNMRYNKDLYVDPNADPCVLKIIDELSHP